MNLDQARLLLLTVPATPVWTGTVVSWDAVDFILTVSTSTGSYPTNIENLVLVADGIHLVRIKSRDTNTLYLAETPIQFLAVASVAIYQARLPWPRYQYIENGVVYKDHDIAFPTPWQAELPPTALLSARVGSNGCAQALYCAIGDTINLDAADSYANLDDGDPLVFAWSPGTDGVITGSGATVTCAYSSNGFRYLKLTVTDAHGTEANRYLPIWVGAAYAQAGVSSCRARWDVKSGWTVDLELQGATSLLQYGPAAIVDAETEEALFFGFIVPSSRAQTFETQTTAITLQSALAFSRFLHAYPFLVTGLTGASEPDNWAEVYDLTLARALWFLLWWHSTLPEVVNTNLSIAPDRDIAGQEFTLGSLPQQVETVCKSAFWQARGERAGGMVVDTDPLFLEAADWAALTAHDLTDEADLRESIRTEYAQPTVSQARLGGVYRTEAGGYEPALVQSPAYPGPFGSPTELNGLAPEDTTEFVFWAIRYIAVENTADTVAVTPGFVVDPVLYWVADLPDSIRISIEQMTLDFDPGGLYWQQQLTGRDYGNAQGSAVGVPLPPDIIYPEPELPPIEPPIWDPLPDSNAVALAYLVDGAIEIWYCHDVLAAFPQWHDITGTLSLGDVGSVAILNQTVYVSTDGAVYYCAQPQSTSSVWVALSAPAGYAYKSGAGMRPLVKRSPDNSKMLIDVWSGNERYAWVIDADHATSSITLVGKQGLPGSLHLSWQGDSYFFAGHAPMSDDGTTEIYIDYGYPEPYPGEGQTSSVEVRSYDGVISYEFALDPTNDTTNWYYVRATGMVVLQSYNDYGSAQNCYTRVKAESGLASPWQIYDPDTNSWVEEIDVEETLPCGAYSTITVVAYRSFLLRMYGGNFHWPSVFWQCRVQGVHQSQNYSGYMVWTRVGSAPVASDLGYLYHIQVPVGYTGDLEDLLFAICDSATCDDEANCCALAGELKACPEWAINIVKALDGQGLVMDEGGNLLYTPAATPCEDEDSATADPPLTEINQGANIVYVGGYHVAVSLDCSELQISDDGFATHTTKAIPGGVGTAFGAAAVLLNRYVVVYGDAGVALYDVSGDAWLDATGDLAVSGTNIDGGETYIGATGG